MFSTISLKKYFTLSIAQREILGWLIHFLQDLVTFYFCWDLDFYTTIFPFLAAFKSNFPRCLFNDFLAPKHEIWKFSSLFCQTYFFPKVLIFSKVLILKVWDVWPSWWTKLHGLFNFNVTPMSDSLEILYSWRIPHSPIEFFEESEQHSLWKKISASKK